MGRVIKKTIKSNRTNNKDKKWRQVHTKRRIKSVNKIVLNETKKIQKKIKNNAYPSSQGVQNAVPTKERLKEH